MKNKLCRLGCLGQNFRWRRNRNQLKEIDIKNKSFGITAEVALEKGGESGVVVTQGGLSAGYALLFVEFIQFTPIVERMPDAASSQWGLRLAGPAMLEEEDSHADVTPWTVGPEEYGDFLIAIYEEWVRKDVGKVFVMNFECALKRPLAIRLPATPP